MAIATMVLEEFADLLPADPAEQRRVFELGLRELRILNALEAYQSGKGSLAFAARQAGVALRQMIPLAYAHGFQPRSQPDLHEEQPLSLEQASEL